MAGDHGRGPPGKRKRRPGQGSGDPDQNHRSAEYGIRRAVDPLFCERRGGTAMTVAQPPLIKVKPAWRNPLRATERAGEARHA